MESEDSYSHSEAPQLSDDSGLLVTSGSFSSDSASGWPQISLEMSEAPKKFFKYKDEDVYKALNEISKGAKIRETCRKYGIPHTSIISSFSVTELQESDYDDRSLSLCESAEPSERMCGVHFNTVKKGPAKVSLTAIEPPPQFQDSPPILKQMVKDEFTLLETDELPPDIILKVETVSSEVPTNQISLLYTKKIKCDSTYERRQCLNQRFASPRLLHLSPCRGTRPASRSSLSSRLSSSHNSLITQLPADDSSFITQAISHDTLSARTSDILDMYNVPFDSDIYALPVDMIHPHSNRHKKKPPKNHRKRTKNVFHAVSNSNIAPEKSSKVAKESRSNDSKESSKRHSLPSSSMTPYNNAESATESMHMTLREARKYLHTLYSSSSDSEGRNAAAACTEHINNPNKDTGNRLNDNYDTNKIESNNNNHPKTKKCNFVNNIKSKKHKENRREAIEDTKIKKQEVKQCKSKSSPVKMLSLNLKQTFCNLFRLKRNPPVESVVSDCEETGIRAEPPTVLPVPRRALPPLPQSPQSIRKPEEDAITDFATSIQKVKDYGWYWGPISVEGAEKILSNEPDGSFIVRDSSDDHYIFTLTFKLNGLRHVRIEHEQGNFCFGGCTMFKAQTIVEFIENAVETSRSGRYLFFLNLRPVLGPVRVQLLYPVSRFKRVQSLQHMCRFVILKVVRRDLVSSLPLPRRIIDYLSATHYFSELVADS